MNRTESRLSDKDYRRALLLTIMLPVLLAAGGALALFLGMDTLQRVVPPCPLHFFTGFNCISCGATRATFALMHGDLRAAVYYNPLYVVLLLVGLYCYIRLMMSLIIRPYRKFTVSLTLPQGLAFAALLILYAVVRNLPFFRAIFY